MTLRRLRCKVVGHHPRVVARGERLIFCVCTRCGAELMTHVEYGGFLPISLDEARREVPWAFTGKPRNPDAPNPRLIRTME